jgi:hypothetical protein
MKLSLKQTIFFNIILPVLIGYCLYHYIHLSRFWINHLPDGLWAYALSYSLIIIWNKQINIFWTVAVFIVFVAFELFQSFHFINGTGDILDVMIYFLFSIIAFLTSKYFFITNNKK